MNVNNPVASDYTSIASNVHINSEGKKIYTINTDLWDDKIRNTLMAHFGDFGNSETMPPEEQAIHASIAEKLKPVFEKEKPLINNDLSTKTHEITGNEVGTQPLRLSLRTRSLPRSENLSELPDTAPLPENETPLIINDLLSCPEKSLHLKV